MTRAEREFIDAAEAYLEMQHECETTGRVSAWGGGGIRRHSRMERHAALEILKNKHAALRRERRKNAEGRRACV